MYRQIISEPVLRQAKVVPHGDTSEYAWQTLRRYNNTDMVTERILHKHKLTKNNDFKNARKQAEQIRFCLQQAKEYHDASDVVTLSTKPVLLYYSLMSLVLAEILWKQSGESSLDFAKRKYRHHGLMFTPRNAPSNRLSEHAAALVATPTPHGTFKLWHRTARNMPLFGTLIEEHPNGGSSRSPQALLHSSNVCMKNVPDVGLNLLDCMKYIPGMAAYLPTFGCETNLVRCKLKCYLSGETPRNIRYDVVVQPGNRHRIDDIKNKMYFDPNMVDKIHSIEFPSGFSLDFGYKVNEEYSCDFPEGFSISEEVVYLLGIDPPLNEFGYFYVSLFICGMYARYYPYLWIKDIEKNEDISLAIELLMKIAQERVPLLILSELSDSYYLVQ